MKKSIYAVIFICFYLFVACSAWAIGQKSHKYLSPMPGSGDHLPETTIIVRYGDAIDPTSLKAERFQVVGTRSGRHEGDLVLSDDEKTLIFKPFQPFFLNERVEVTVLEGIASMYGNLFSPIHFYFTTSAGRTASALGTRERMEGLSAYTNAPLNAFPNPTSKLALPPYVTLPEDFPALTITAPADGTADGYLFFSTLSFGPNQAGLYSLIIDNRGEPIFYQKGWAVDFKKLPNGNLVIFNDCFAEVLNTSYQLVETVKAGNGYSCMDFHDLRLLPNGHYLFFIYHNRTGVNLVPFGGIENATVIETVIQEVDRGGNVVFEWRSWDPGNFSYGDTADFISLSDTNPIDYIHTNAVELDGDGNILISSRHLNEITKIDRSTGAIIWRLGGKQNQFTFTTALPMPENGLNFFCQHDVRRLVDNRISLFDNHNINGGFPIYSRGLEYELDENNRIADLKREVRNAPDTVSWAMGNSQRLSNGNTLNGWGTSSSPLLTEFKPDGSKAFELFVGSNLVSYRAFRFTWHGHPTWAPALVVQKFGADTKLSFSWNGATETAYYEIYGGMTPHPDKLISSSLKINFEDSMLLTGEDARYCFYRILPVDNLGRRTIYSEVVSNPQCGFVRFLPLITNQGDQPVN